MKCQFKIINFILLSGLFLIGCFIFWPSSAVAVSGMGEKDSFPKIANYFLTSDQNFNYDELSKYDLLILPVDTQIYNPNFFSYARKQNPDIIILAYTPAQSVNVTNLNDTRSFNYKLNQQIQNSWWMQSISGQIISTWQGIKNINIITSGWSDWFPGFIKKEVLDTGFWDGIFYDMIDERISWVNGGDVDLDNNGKKDDPALADSNWQNGIVKLLNKSRQVFGSNKIIVINGSSLGKYQSQINGRMFEDFPTPWQGQGSWTDSMNALNENSQHINFDKIFILNSLGNQQDYQKMRYGLTSALIAGAYFSYDNDIAHHNAVWWFDEYDVNLGEAVNEAEDLLNKFSVQYNPGVWRRDFSAAVALVNSTDKSQTLNLDKVYEKIKGSQDKMINSGELVNKITLQSNDGIILLNKLDLEIDKNILKGVVFKNGSYVRVFNKQGQVKRTGFYAYDLRFVGGTLIAYQDLDNDDKLETIVADNSKIQIFKSNGLLTNTIYPYGKNYKSGINFAIGNILGDLKLEIVTGTNLGGGPHIRIFDSSGILIHPGFFAYDKNFRGGVNVALGDLNGNGYKEIITGAGFSGGPHIRIFNSSGHLFDPGFFAYSPNFRGGVNITTADLNGDKKDEIITGAGKGGGPHIRIFDKIGHLVDLGFFAFDPGKRSGVMIGARDVDGDGEVEILGME